MTLEPDRTPSGYNRDSVAIDRLEPAGNNTVDSPPEAKYPASEILVDPALIVSFKPGWRFYAAFTSLCIITLAVALDATTLSVALPVNSISLLHQLALMSLTSTCSSRSSPKSFEAPQMRPSGLERRFSSPPPFFSQHLLPYPTPLVANHCSYLRLPLHSWGHCCRSR